MQIVCMNQKDIINYYSQNFVQKAIASIGKNREIASSKLDGSYMKRPDIISYPRDIIEKAKLGAATFHCSVEKWKNPMQLGSELSRKDLDELRMGWDLILDIDAKSKMEHSKIAAIVVCNFLKDLGINPLLYAQPIVSSAVREKRHHLFVTFFKDIKRPLAKALSIFRGRLSRVLDGIYQVTAFDFFTQTKYEREWEKMRQGRPGTLLAVLFIARQLDAGRHIFPGLEPLESWPVPITARSYLQLYRVRNKKNRGSARLNKEASASPVSEEIQKLKIRAGRNENVISDWNEFFRREFKRRNGSPGRLSENTMSANFYVDNKGLTTSKLGKNAIVGQPPRSLAKNSSFSFDSWKRLC